MNTALDLMGASNQRIDFALFGFGVQVNTVFRQRALFASLAIAFGKVFCNITGASDGALFSISWILGYPMGDKDALKTTIVGCTELDIVAGISKKVKPRSIAERSDGSSGASGVCSSVTAGRL